MWGVSGKGSGDEGRNRKLWVPTKQGAAPVVPGWLERLGESVLGSVPWWRIAGRSRIVALECNYQDVTRGGIHWNERVASVKISLGKVPAFHSLRKITMWESFCEEREFGDPVSDGSELQCLPIPRRLSRTGVLGPPSATSRPAEVQLYFS